MNMIMYDYECTSVHTVGRYVGSMVSDVHRTVLYGGVYLYPADKAKVTRMIIYKIS